LVFEEEGEEEEEVVEEVEMLMEGRRTHFVRAEGRRHRNHTEARRMILY